MFAKLTRRQLAWDIGIPAGILFLTGLFTFTVDPPSVLVLIGLCAALVFRRLRPGIALAAAWLVAIAEMAATLTPSPANILILGVLYATAAHGTRLERWLGFGSAFLGALLVALYVSGPLLVDAIMRGSASQAFSAGLSVAFTGGAALAGFLLAWTVGLLVSVGRRGRESRLAAAEAELEVVAEQERTRIARDMHDVVAHSLAVVIAQADGARYLRKTDPDAVDEALITIASTSREALADVRVLLAQLRHSQGDAPQPVLADLDRLVEQMGSSGLDVHREEAGVPLTLGTSTQLAVYRIVQESLTNALRHGDREQPVVVRFDWTPGGLHLAVASALPAEPPAPSTSTGHGIAGMSERASLVGGNLGAGASNGRFVVRAWLPTDPTFPDSAPVRQSTA